MGSGRGPRSQGSSWVRKAVPGRTGCLLGEEALDFVGQCGEAVVEGVFGLAGGGQGRRGYGVGQVAESGR